jgi:hypothetical protein
MTERLKTALAVVGLLAALGLAGAADRADDERQQADADHRAAER